MKKSFNKTFVLTKNYSINIQNGCVLKWLPVFFKGDIYGRKYWYILLFGWCFELILQNGDY